ncbi:hypothetical protein DVH24_030971 [Malus domestica]|uniref:non-specific serine/threonine protein kinase n=1 Tax=Malus domestica TaxID=3750 RepID=A0A498HAZ7_MALDO|nr:hypothetical protein DVH24_030971 [Malus domestica]
MTFCYQCPTAITLPSTQSRNISNIVSFVYYLTRPVTVDQASSVSCTHEAIVPVYTEAALTIEAATEPSQTIVTDAVEGGFSLQLEIDNDECNKCLDSGGRCGLNTTSNSGFSCFYANRAYASICNGTSNSSRSGGNRMVVMHVQFEDGVKLNKELHTLNVQVDLKSKNQQFTNCSSNITCGSVGGISYPFWGVNRASYCGQPGFEVQCLNNLPVFNMKGASYRILQMNTTNSRTVKVARNDYWGTICPQTFVNTTLNFSLFDYVSGYRNMTFYYQCFAAITLPSPQSCNISNTVNPVYYVTQPVTVGQAYSVSCTHEVIVPVYEEAALAIEAATVRSQTIVTEAVEGGFSLQLEIDNDECDKCLGSGGQCGLDNTTNSGFRCFCADRAYASTCNGTSTSSQGGGTPDEYPDYPDSDLGSDLPIGP